MTDTSPSLLECLKNPRNDSAWQRFVGLYTPLIQGQLRRLGLQSSDSDDLAQEVMRALVTELPRFQQGQHPGAFRAWLRQITLNRARGFWRARQHRPLAIGNSAFEEVLDQLEDPSSGLSKQWDEEHDSHVARRMLESVKPGFTASTWQAFERVALNDEKPAVVASDLGISVGAVWIAKSRVLRRLRQELQGLVE